MLQRLCVKGSEWAPLLNLPADCAVVTATICTNSAKIRRGEPFVPSVTNRVVYLVIDKERAGSGRCFFFVTHDKQTVEPAKPSAVSATRRTQFSRTHLVRKDGGACFASQQTMYDYRDLLGTNKLEPSSDGQAYLAALDLGLLVATDDSKAVWNVVPGSLDKLPRYNFQTE